MRVVIQPHGDVEAFDAIEQYAHRFAAQLLRTMVSTSSAFMPWRASSSRFTAMRICGLPMLASRAVRPRQALVQHALDPAAELVELAQVFAVELERQGGAHAGDQFLHAHLDRLGVTGHHVGNHLSSVSCIAASSCLMSRPDFHWSSV